MNHEHMRAAMLGLALGDAYGRGLEFVSGPTVRTRPVVIPSPEFMWTDDTHMALYLVDALKHAGCSGLSPLSEDSFGRAVGEAFVQWSADPLTPSTAPGNTCLRGAAAFASGGDWRRSGVPESDGCGAVMRIAPLAAVFQGPELVTAARVQALVTHAHPNAPAAAVAASMLVRSLLDGHPLQADLVLSVSQQMRELPVGTETVARALEAAVAQATRRELDWLDEDDIPDGDGGWRSPSALGLAVVAAIRWTDDFEFAIDKAARIDGDSDSVACLTGMLIGASRGMSALPSRWLHALPQRARIDAACDDLLALAPLAPSNGLQRRRTSTSHPIRVDWLPVDLGTRGGKLGITFAPGKRASSLSGPSWDRTLDTDLQRLRTVFEVDVLVSLIEDEELSLLGIPELVAKAEAAGIGLIRHPVVDGLVPIASEARRTLQSALTLARSGQRVVFHCRGGLGRAGTFAACALIHLGHQSRDAIQVTRSARPGAIENVRQEDFVLRYDSR